MQLKQRFLRVPLTREALLLFADYVYTEYYEKEKTHKK